jgi:hypothetical protein
MFDPVYFSSGSNRTGILVSSMAGLSSACIQEYLSGGISFFDSGRWTAEEYRQACADREFLRSVLPNLKCGEGQDSTAFNPTEDMNLDLESVSRLIDEKYFYVGGCARWMFAMRHEVALFNIHACLECVDDYNILLERRRGIRTIASCNQLRVRFQGCAASIIPNDDLVFVSNYVARLALNKCELSVIKSAYDLADYHNNPAFLGWVLEFDFVAQLKIAAKAPGDSDRVINVYSVDGATETWRVPGICEFDKFSLFLVQRELNDSCWLRPKDWNEAGYDLVCLIQNDDGNRILRFVQITRGKSHSLNLTYFGNVATHVQALIGMDICVDIVVLSPCGWGNTHTPPRIKFTGSGLSKWRVLSGDAQWSDGQEAAAHIRCFAFHPCNMVELGGQVKALARGRRCGQRGGQRKRRGDLEN